jgi:ubiquinone/menaquinone biosynthesis C-methylase UbiE
MKHTPQGRSVHTHSTHGFAHPTRNVGALGIEPGMVVADFGSGSGAYVLAIAEVLAGSGKVYAVDVQKDLLRRTHNEAVKRGFSIVHILWCDLEKPHGSKLADKSCDVVLVSNLLFQVEDKREVMREAKRVLRPRGTLAIIDWQESFGGLGPIKEHVFNKSSALSLASATGFVFNREFNAGAHHYGLIFHLGQAAQ